MYSNYRQPEIRRPTGLLSLPYLVLSFSHFLRASNSRHISLLLFQLEMDIPARKKRYTKRSRSGCFQCGDHHQKCDERRPICSLCETRGRACQYGLRIRWEGPSRQRKRASRSTSSPLVTSNDGGFTIYRPGPVTPSQDARLSSVTSWHGANASGLVDIDLALFLPRTNILSSCSEDMAAGRIGGPARPEHALTPLSTPVSFPGLPPAYQPLFQYFERVSTSLSCDLVVKEAFLTTFVPMAMETSHLMASLLYLCALHRLNTGLDQSERQLALLRSVAVEQLRSKLVYLDNSSNEPIIATVLLLCYAGVIAGGSEGTSWRMHLEGSASLLNKAISSWTLTSDSQPKAFLSRCFVSIAALANLSRKPPTDFASKQALCMTGYTRRPGYIDEFLAYSTDLIPVFEEIGTLLRRYKQQALPSDNGEVKIIEQSSLDLIERIRAMVKVEPRVEKISAEMASGSRYNEYLRVNEAYHQAAILHIQQRLLRLPPSAIEIQEAVVRIISLLEGVELAIKPCPGVVLLFPLFSAGCGAIQVSDRYQVRSMLEAMDQMYGLVTVRHSIQVLKRLWTHRTRHGDSDLNVLWDSFVGECLSWVNIWEVALTQTRQTRTLT